MGASICLRSLGSIKLTKVIVPYMAHMERLRKKKSDKAKEKRDRTPYSAKHVRLAEVLQERPHTHSKPKTPPK